MPVPEPMPREEADALRGLDADEETMRRLYALARQEKARALRLDDQLLMLTDQCRRTEARAKEAEKERDEEISEETDFWEKKAAKAEARLVAAAAAVKELTEARMRQILNGDVGSLLDAVDALCDISFEETKK